VITCAALAVFTACAAKARLVGERLTAVPTPVRITVCGLLEALSLMTMDDLRGPAAVGANVTWIVQNDPEFRLLPQLLLSPKSPLFDPDFTMPDIERVPAVALVMEIVWGELVLPTT
jgi:hypothetical protein